MRTFFTIVILTTLSIFQTIAAPRGVAFTAQEQQQISIETPGLFDKSPMFQVDLAGLGANYSFPLPVGKLAGSTATEIELETKSGDAVKAVFDGTVRLSRNTPNYGNVVVIRHQNGLETVYAHNAENLVKSGDRVRAGQSIALVGEKNGRGYLLFFIMVNGNRIKPGLIFNINNHALRKTHLVFQKSDAGASVIVRTLKSKNKELEASRTQATPQMPNAANPRMANAVSPHRPGASTQVAMDLETNDPFQGNAVYRLDLDQIKSWKYPLDDAHLISGYGGRRGHSGSDIKNGPGTNVYAAFDGKVVQEGNFAGYGKCITVRHPNGLETRYSHNSKNLVNIGDMVKAGQVIAIVGRTGRATTEHLHFETRIAGRAFNPEYVFDHKTNTLQHGVLQFKKGGSVVRLK